MNRNPAQTEAICHGDGPMLVLAGPGSGKTTVITGRVRHLIEHYGVHPEQILVITFSKSAALEMRERFDSLTGHAYSGVHFGTFHACFFHILKLAYQYNASHILRDHEALAILTDIFARIRPDYAAERDLVRNVLQEFMRYKGSYTLCSEEERAAFTPVSCDRDTFFGAYRAYEKELRTRGRVDFEDMLYLTYELLSQRPDILAFWQERYRYLLIDEFQDINELQYRIVQLLTAKHRNLFVVGDDDQSIYGFRGASSKLMLHFPDDYPDCKRVLLDVNYRCRPAIVEAAGNLIRTNTDRFAKTIHAAKPAGEPVHFPVFESVLEENEYVVGGITELLRSAVPPSEIAVLYRTNLQLRSLGEQLLRHGIPFSVHGVLPCLYENPYVLIVLSYLRVALGSRKRADLLPMLNKPNRYVERSMLRSTEIDVDALIASYEACGKRYVADRLRLLSVQLAKLSRMNPYAAIHYIRHVIGLNEYLMDTCDNSEEIFETLDELMENARHFTNIGDFLDYIQEYYESYREQTTVRKQVAEEGIVLTTFHSCKGLEFSYVYICDCNELLTPHKKALLPEHIAEERRLFYVAMTRAKERLVLCRVKKRFGRAMEPSRFLGEIQLPVSALIPGARVVHKQFGVGTIVHRDGDRLQLRLDRHLLPKTLSLRHCIESQLLSPAP